MELVPNSINVSDPMYGCSGTVKQTASFAESILTACTMFIIIIISIFGNGLVIYAVYSVRTLHKVTYTLLCSLATSDLLSPFLRLLVIAISNTQQRWIFGCNWCSISSQIGIMFCSSSIIHLCVITLERFLLIHYPLRHDLWLTKKRLVILISFVWLLSLAMAFLPYVSNIIDQTFNRNVLNCEIYYYKRPHLSLALLAIYFGVPLVMMIVVYRHIFHAAVQQTRKISVNSVANKSVKRKRLLQQEWKAFKTVLIVVGMFLLLWTPYFSIEVIKAYSPTSLPHWVDRFGLCCAYTNCCCNWVIYSVRNIHVRTAFKRILHLEKKNAGVLKNLRLENLHGLHKCHSETFTNRDSSETMESYERNKSRKFNVSGTGRISLGVFSKSKTDNCILMRYSQMKID